MIKLFVIAGNNHEKLSEFLSNRGTFTVDFSYDNFSDNISSIQNKIVKADKMLYLYQVDDNNNTSINIKSDMRILKTLLASNDFFDPGEIIFITNKSEQSDLAIQYFTTVMNSCKKTDYSIKCLSDRLTFASIYDAIMGVTVTRDFKNTYNEFYRVERNAEADLAYVGQDDTSLIIEPFKYDSLSNYESRKQAVVKTDSGYIHTDSENTVTKTYQNPDFGALNVQNVLNEQKIVLVSGEAKTGKSVWSGMLAKSAIEGGDTVCLLDFSSKSDVGDFLKQTGVAVHETSMLNLLRGCEPTAGSLYLSHCRNAREEDVKMEFLQNLFSKRIETFSVIFIVVDYSDFVKTYNLLKHAISHVLLTIVPRNTDVIYVKEIVDTVCENSNVSTTLILNESVKLLATESYMEAQDIKVLMGDQVRIVKSKYFTDFDIGPRVFKAIVT